MNVCLFRILQFLNDRFWRGVDSKQALANDYFSFRADLRLAGSQFVVRVDEGVDVTRIGLVCIDNGQDVHTSPNFRFYKKRNVEGSATDDFAPVQSETVARRRSTSGHIEPVTRLPQCPLCVNERSLVPRCREPPL